MNHSTTTDHAPSTPEPQQIVPRPTGHSGPLRPDDAARAAAEAWDQAVEAYTAWIGPIGNGPAREAQQRFRAYCRGYADSPAFADAAPLLAFGFLTRMAFKDAKRATRIFGA